MSNPAGTLVVLSGPTGVGKSTVGEAIIDRMGDAVRIVTATTRKPRENEVQDVDYHFHSKEEFLVGIARDEYLEHAEVHGNFYGTPRASVEEALSKGKVVVLVIDVDGGEQIRALDMNALLIFLNPPSRKALWDRAHKRGTESEAELAMRLKRVDKEVEKGESYDVNLINDDLETCIAECIAAIEKHRAG